MLSYASVVLAASLALGQADQRNQDRRLQEASRVHGTWEAKDVEAVGRSRRRTCFVEADS